MKDMNFGVAVTLTVGTAEVTFEVRKSSQKEPLKLQPAVVVDCIEQKEKVRNEQD